MTQRCTCVYVSTVLGVEFPACLAAAVCTCSGELQTLLFAHARFVVGVHEAVDVGAAAAAHRHRLPHQHPTNGNAVHLTQDTDR